MNLRETIIDGYCTCHQGPWGAVIPPPPCAYCRAVKAWQVGVRDVGPAKKDPWDTSDKVEDIMKDLGCKWVDFNSPTEPVGTGHQNPKPPKPFYVIGD